MDAIPILTGTPEEHGFRLLHRAHGRSCALCGRSGGHKMKCLCHGEFYCDALHYLYHWPLHKEECNARRRTFRHKVGSEAGFLKLQDWIHSNSSFLGRGASNALLELRDHNIGTNGIFETKVLYIRLKEVNTDVRRQGVQIVGMPQVCSKTAARAAYAALDDEEHWNELEAYSRSGGRGAGVLTVLLRFIGAAYESLECIHIDVTEADLRGWRDRAYKANWFEMLKVVTTEFPERFVTPEGDIVAIRHSD